MGKSPGKWIKTALFGKKTSKSHSAQGKEKPVNGKETRVRVMTSEPGIDDNPQEVPNGGLGAVHVDKQSSSSEHRDVSFIQPDQEIQGSRDLKADVEQTRDLGMVTDAERIAQEKAATKTQAAFRGYLARRAFKALRGIIRLQALIRGHLVRRQAVATLYCIVGIVKLQALVRGSRIRCSDAGIEVQRVCIMKPLDVSTRRQRDVASTRTSSLSANAFIRKLLALSPEGMPLQIHYDETDSNSVQMWLERWSISCPWKPVSPPKKAAGSKVQKKQGTSLAVEGAIVRPKRSVRKVQSVFDNPSVQSTSEMEKPRRNPKKVSTLLSHPADSVQENPQTELEKVKRSLRKVQNSLTESSAPPEVTERAPQSQAKTMPAIVQEDLDPVEVNPVENMKEETIFILKEDAIVVPKANNLESSEDPVETIKSLEFSQDEITKVKSGSLEGDKKEYIPAPNGKLKPTAEPMPNENQKSGRRASLSANQEHAEDGLQNTPRVPSYMQATKSAKAKLRAQGSPDVGQDSSEQNNLMRRHSLSSPANGKVSSVSPRTPKPLQSGGKGGNKNDKSLLSSREGNGKATQGWRR